MQFVLTPSPNVTAERARLRVLRDQIAANVAARKEHDRKFTPRGFDGVRAGVHHDARAVAWALAILGEPVCA